MVTVHHAEIAISASSLVSTGTDSVTSSPISEPFPSFINNGGFCFSVPYFECVSLFYSSKLFVKVFDPGKFSYLVRPSHAKKKTFVWLE